MDNKTNNSIQMQCLYERILLIMDKQQPYLDPQLTLGKLVRIIGTNRTFLSTTINRQSKVNFNTWLASYRVSHLLEALRNNPGKSFDELYPSSGFASRTSFYRQFRLVTGVSPQEYIQSFITAPDGKIVYLVGIHLTSQLIYHSMGSQINYFKRGSFHEWLLMFVLLLGYGLSACQDDKSDENTKPDSKNYFEGEIRFERLHTKTVPGDYDCVFVNQEDNSELHVRAIVISDDGDIVFVPESPIRVGEYIFAYAQAVNQETIEAIGNEGEVALGCQLTISNDQALTAKDEPYDEVIGCYGNGSKEQPYKVSTGEKLKDIGKAINNAGTHAQYAGKYYKQIANLNMARACSNLNTGWRPIGNQLAYSFYGHYDGNGKTIRNLSAFNTTSDINPAVPVPMGLFGIVSGGTIRNVKMAGSGINSSFGSCGMIIGSVVSSGDKRSKVALENCLIENSCDIQTAALSGGMIGSIDQYAYVTIKGCTNNMNIKAEYMGVGGLVGAAFMTSTLLLDSCTNTGAISGKLASIGGLVGAGDTITFIDCRNTGTITNEIYNDKGLGTGGLGGHVLNAIVTYSDNDGEVNGGDETGGLIGSSAYSVKDKIYGNVLISGSSNSGAIKGRNRTGGLVGGGQISTDNSYNFSSVSSSGMYAGGIAGLAPIALIQNSCNDGNVSSASTSDDNYTGGLIAAAQDFLISGSSNYGTVSGQGGYTGGIMGGCDMLGVLSFCGNYGKVEGSGTSVGGIIGRAGKPKNMSDKMIADLVLGTVMSAVSIGVSSTSIKTPKLEPKMNDVSKILSCISSLNDLAWTAANNIGSPTDYTQARFQQLHKEAREELAYDHHAHTLFVSYSYMINGLNISTMGNQQQELQESFAKRIDAAENNTYTENINTWRQQVEDKMSMKEKMREDATHVGEGFAFVGDVLGFISKVPNPLSIVVTVVIWFYNLVMNLTDYSYNRVGIFEAYNYGQVKSTNGKHTGGIAGELHDYARIYDSYNAGPLSPNSKAGAIFGKGGHLPEVERFVNYGQEVSELYRNCPFNEKIHNNENFGGDKNKDITNKKKYSFLNLLNRWQWNTVPLLYRSQFEPN